MLYTRKGDGGTTKIFDCDQRLSKSSAVAEALGAVDEINSLLGVVKVKTANLKVRLPNGRLASTITAIQHNLFIVQAELAGARQRAGKPLVITPVKVKKVEKVIDEIEKVLPPIKTFFVAGGTELGALFDFARTVARRAERRAVRAVDEGLAKLSPPSLAYLNRLSSLLYALARLVNHQSGIKEEAPTYK